MTSAPSTIGHYRSHGITTALLYCAGTFCSHSARIAFDDLGLPDDTVFLDIPSRLSFRCERCGARKVEVRVDWPDPMEMQRRRTLG